MTKEEILAQPEYKGSISEFLSKSINFDVVAKAYQSNKDPQKDEQLRMKYQSAWSLYAYYFAHLLYLADHIKDADATAATEAAKDLRKLAFDNFQDKLEYILLITAPNQP